MSISRSLALALLLALAAFTQAAPRVDAQTNAPVRQPLDVMLVIDNSCSMFPASQRIPGCEVWGNDPGFLRITGASLFIARTGFALPAASDYQLGVIGMGDNPPELVSPLTGLDQARDALAQAISNPQPKLATQIVPALEMAYRELRDSPNRRPGNLPAVVLLTDGAPFPAEGQSNEDIEQLVAANPDVPLFVILLQNRAQAAPAASSYERYIRFWNEVALRHNFVRSYPVNSTEEIERTYDEIVARLENTVARPPLSLAPGQTLEVFISRYIQRAVFTFTRERGAPPADIAITDPAGVRVGDGDADVQRFQGQDNPVQIVAIGRGRLEAAPRDANWKITSSEQVIVHIDMEGSYRVQFIEPEASPTAVPGQFLVDRPHGLGQPLTLRLQLLDNASGSPVTDPQPIKIAVTKPDGSTGDISVPTDLRPDAQGVYTIPYDLATGANETEGRYAFAVESGSIPDPSGAGFPVARAELLVDVRRAGFISGVTPETIQCGPPWIDQEAPNLDVAIGGLETSQVGAARASALAGGQEVVLAPNAGGTGFTGSAGPLCDALAATLSCGSQVTGSIHLRITLPGAGSLPLERDIPALIATVACTPTPIPTATFTPTPSPTPTPAPTPIPDSDGDGTHDLADRCIDQASWGFAPWFGGCPPPLAAQVAGALAGAGLLAFLGFWAAPAAMVMTLRPPPAGYVQVFRNGKADGPYKSLRSLGQSARKSTITIGSKGLLKVSGMEPVELRVERRGDVAAVLRGPNGPQLFQIREIPSTHTASGGSGITLKFSTDPRQLR